MAARVRRDLCLSWSSVEEFLVQEGPVLLEMRVKQLMKERQQAKATLLAKTCSQSPAMQGQGPFRQMYLVCLCATSEQEELMEEVSATCTLSIPTLGDTQPGSRSPGPLCAGSAFEFGTFIH